MLKEGLKTVAIIVAAGRGARAKSKLPKQFLDLAGKPILAYTLERFEESEAIDQIVVVVAKPYVEFCRKEIIGKFDLRKVRRIVSGGDHRQLSVFKGLKALDRDTDVVLIHDGVRPLVRTGRIGQIIKACQGKRCVVLGVPLGETAKRVEGSKVITTLDRSMIWKVQTPQAFPYKTIMCAYEKAHKDGVLGTDDSFLVERMGVDVKVVEGDQDNIKITTREDLRLAECLLRKRMHE